MDNDVNYVDQEKLGEMPGDDKKSESHGYQIVRREHFSRKELREIMRADDRINIKDNSGET